MPTPLLAQGQRELFIPPTYQADAGGLGLGIGTYGLWPATSQSAVRMIFEVPSDLQTFGIASVVFIPGPDGASVLSVMVCSGQNGDLVIAPCDGPLSHPLPPFPDQITEVDISGIVGPHVSLGGPRYVSVVAFTSPITTVEHMLRMRFTYVPQPDSNLPGQQCSPQQVVVGFDAGGNVVCTPLPPVGPWHVTLVPQAVANTPVVIAWNHDGVGTDGYRLFVDGSL